MSTTQPCPFCGDDAEAVPVDEIPDFVRVVYPREAGAVVPNARDLKQGQVALVHHGCLSPQAGTNTPWWNPDSSWWACRDRERPLDADAHFDLNCEACAERWSAEHRN